MSKIRSKNLEAALEFLYKHKGEAFLPDEIKEKAYKVSGQIETGLSFCAMSCSHASTGRMLRRAHCRGDEYKGLRLCRGSRRNKADNEDLATFFLAPAEQGRE